MGKYSTTKFIGLDVYSKTISVAIARELAAFMWAIAQEVEATA
jgi:hypothetical protein